MGGPGSGRKPNAARDAIISRLRGEGLTFTEIGWRVGVTRQMVKLVCDRLGVTALAARGARAAIKKRWRWRGDE